MPDAREATERASTARARPRRPRLQPRRLEEARQRLTEAEAYLEEVKNTLPLGGSWWMEREWSCASGAPTCRPARAATTISV
jgi:hypothetical protein